MDPANPTRVLPFDDNQDCDVNGLNCVATTAVEDAIRSLRVVEPFVCPLDGSTPPGTCLYFDPEYKGAICWPNYLGTRDASGDLITDAGGNVIKNPTSCGGSNIGGALYMAGDEFVDARQESFWAVIALIGGPANAAVPEGAASPNESFCPQATWKLPRAASSNGYCRDEDYPIATRHYRNADGTFPTAYDADDYARDGADHITSPTTGQGATLYSICLGTQCSGNSNTNDPASAEHLGQYMALQSGGVNANHGLYFQTNDPADLAKVFRRHCRQYQHQNFAVIHSFKNFQSFQGYRHEKYFSEK